MARVVQDSRRVPGANVVWPRACAVLDLSWPDAEAPRARQILDAVGWGGEDCAERLFPGGATLAVSAPFDALYSATEVNEWAWSAAGKDRKSVV